MGGKEVSDVFMGILHARNTVMPPDKGGGRYVAAKTRLQHSGGCACAHPHAPPAMERERNASRRRAKRRRLASVYNKSARVLQSRPPFSGGMRRCKRQRTMCQWANAPLQQFVRFATLLHSVCGRPEPRGAKAWQVLSRKRRCAARQDGGRADYVTLRAVATLRARVRTGRGCAQPLK